MDVLILNGLCDDTYINILESVKSHYEQSNNKVETFTVHEHSINYCQGCFSCWIKTPGRCIHKDDTNLMLKRVIESDRVVIVTQNSLGYIDSMTKKALDKWIPLVHPYIIIDKNECHHRARYMKYPVLDLVYIDPNSEKADYLMTCKLFKRLAINFKSNLDKTYHIDPLKEVEF